jgi:hypothetical protein
MATAGVAPGTNGWYAWDQVPTATPGENYLLFLNDQNEVRRTTVFTASQSNFIARVNSTGTNIEFVPMSSLVNAANGLSVRGDTVLLGGTLIENTTINTAGFNMVYTNASATPSTFTLGNNSNTFNVNIDVGTNGDLNLQNIDVDTTAPNILVTDATGNVRTRSLASFVQVDADNGLTTTTSGAITTVHLGSAATGGAQLQTNRFIDLNSNTLNYEGSGTVNVGTGGDVNLAVNTGATGNMSIQGTTLNSTTNFNNLLYTDGNNVRRATTAAMDSIAAPNQFITIDANGNIGRSASPTIGFIRGQIAGTGTFQYTVNNINIQSGAAINATVENHSGVLGAIIVQVTNVTNGTNGSFSVETSENIESGSFINYTVINP